MTPEDLQRQGLLQPAPPSAARYRAAIKRARRSLVTARAVLESDHDWAFVIAYDAALQAAMGLLAVDGWRTRPGEGSHKAVVEYAKIVTSAGSGMDIRFFDKMRRDRHRAVYDAAGAITRRHAEKALEFSSQFVAWIENEGGRRSGGTA